jgi:hypothetical protein
MLFVHARTNSVVLRLHAIFLVLMIAAGLAFVTTNPGRGEESPAYAIEVSDVTANVGERAVMQAKLHVRDGYRILQSYNNRVIKLSAEDDGVAFEQECPSSNGLGQSELFRDGGSGSFGLEFRRLSTDVAIVAV